MLEDFPYRGLSFIVWEFEGEKSHATGFEVGLTLNENKQKLKKRSRLE